MAANNHNRVLAYLREEFLRDAKVLDSQRGYISVSSFNVRMKASILKASASLISDHFRKDIIDIVHGIPHSGNFLATAVALELGGDIRIHSSRKDHNIPNTWKDVYHEEIRSYTMSGQFLTVFSGINLSFVKKGDRVLLVDDVCATGETGYQIVEGLIQRGVNVVGFAVLFDKIFQGGLEYIDSLGVKTFSCIRVEKINADDKVILAKMK